MNEAYRIAMQQIKDRCKAHTAKFGERPSVLGVDEATFETLRSGTHASKDALQIVIPYTEEVEASAGIDLPALWFVAVMKEEKPV